MACPRTPRSIVRCLALAVFCSTSQVPGTPLLAATGPGLGATDVNADQFAIVSAPIHGSGSSQLQIYEQISSQRPCYSINGSTVEPLLVSFDFTNICQRYIDSNGYSLRIGERDLATTYRLSIRRNGSQHLLIAVPTRPGAGPELQIAKASGDGDNFLRLQLEPGWLLRRRHWQGINLNHLYVYRDSWPQASEESLASTASSQPEATANPKGIARMGTPSADLNQAAGNATLSPAGTARPLF